VIWKGITKVVVANKFDLVATGGTFDEIHIGHIALLSKAFELGKRVIIGVTSDDFAEKTKGEKKLNHSYDKRVFNLKDIIQKKFGRVSYKISKLDNEYGPIVILGRVDALIASTETAKKGEKINEIRSKKGLPPIAIISVDLIRTEDGSPISSTRIREGEIDPFGKILKVK
jgi:pantetheine-phosphate adenylyltransferase